MSETTQPQLGPTVNELWRHRTEGFVGQIESIDGEFATVSVPYLFNAEIRRCTTAEFLKEWSKVMPGKSFD